MKIEISKGDNIYSAASRAVNAAHRHGTEVSFEFNEITLHVSPFSHADDIGEIYSLKCQIRRLQKGLDV